MRQRGYQQTDISPAGKTTTERKAASAAERSARSGSVAGRGYRYQDEVAGYVAVLGMVGDISLDCIYCEGLEDINLESHGVPVRVQVKSRRPGLPPHSSGHVASDIADLLRRHRETLIAVPGSRVALASESLPADLSETGWDHSLTDGDASFRILAAAFATLEDAPDTDLLRRVSLVCLPSPATRGAERLRDHFDLLPIASQLVFLRFRQALADSADANHDGVALSYSKTALEGLRVASLEAVNVEALEAALTEGIIEPLDLTSPLEDTAFYLGVDAQPGHLVAGYLLPRPGETQRIVDGLRNRRAVLIAGPSGAGKSALTWLAAAETAHEITWYRAKRLTAEGVEPIARLTRALGDKNAGSRVGIIVDDVGRSPGPWDDLAALAASRPGVVVLGSVREEDLVLVSARQHTTVERPSLGDQLADAIYERLRDLGETNWAGWREPHEVSNGLLLEYVHILTAGTRLEDTINRQVQARLSDEGRHYELAVLRLVAMADTYGCEVRLDSLRTDLKLTHDQLGAALQRLYAEHLVREAGQESVGGLHQLRSAAIVRATHAFGSPTEKETAVRLLQVLDGFDLTVVIAALLEPSQGPGEDVLRSVGMATIPGTSILEPDAIQGVLQERLARTPSIAVVTAVLQGLRLAGFLRTAREWWRIMDDAQIPVSQRQLAANFALVESEPSQEVFPNPLITVIRRLRESPVIDLREGMAEAIGIAIENSAEEPAPGQMEALLLAAARWDEGDGSIRDRATLACAHYGNESLETKIKLLEAAFVHSEATAVAIAESLGGESELLSQYAAQQPWIYGISRDDGPEDRVVAAKWLFIDTSIAHGDPSTLWIREAENVHDAVVAVCRDLLALQPSANLAKVAAVGPDGELAGFGGHVIADKSIPRANLPTNGAVVWNRIRLAIADMLAWTATSTTDRLVAESELLRRLMTETRSFADHWVLGSYSRVAVPAEANEALKELAALGDEAALLPSPSSPVSVGVLLRTLSDPRTMPDLPRSNATSQLVSSIATNVVPRLLAEDGYAVIGSYVGTSILSTIQNLDGDKRWELVETDALENLGGLRIALQDLHDFLEAINGRPVRIVRRLRNGATGRPSPLSTVGNRVREAAVGEGKENSRKISEHLQQALGDAARVEVVYRPCADRYGLLWPPYDYCALVHSENPLVLMNHEADLMTSRGPLPIVATLAVMPVLRNQAVAHLAVNVFANTVYPNPDLGSGWAVTEGLNVVASPGWEAAQALVSALVTTSAVLRLREERGSRPIEELVYARATTRFSEGVLALYQIVSAAAGEPSVDDIASIVGMSAAGQTTVPGQALSALLGWAEGVAREEAAVGSTGTTTDAPGDFAAIMSRALRGQEPSLLGQLVVISVLLLLNDVDSDLATGFLNAL